MKKIIVLLLALTLAFTGCGDGSGGDGGGGGSQLSGTITIKQDGYPVTGTVYTYEELLADYDGPETVSYQWKRGTTPVGQDNANFTPEEAGQYTVTVSAPGKVSKTSQAVTVIDNPNLQELDGEVLFYVDDDLDNPAATAQTGQKITAVYGGDEFVNYQWFKDGAVIPDPDNEETMSNTTWTPLEAGSYTVRLTGATPGEYFPLLWDPPVVVTGSTLITITFDLNGPDGETPQVLVAPGAALGTLPDTPPYNGFTFKGWYTAKTGGTKLTETSSFNASRTVYAQWTFGGGTPYVDGETLVHPNPRMEAGLNFAGTISNEDGTISYTAGAFQYKFPTVTDTGDNITIGGYAYFIVRYELKSASGNKSGVQLKQYGNDTDYGGLVGNDRYPWLSSQSSLRFSLSGATNGGFSMRFSGTAGEAIVVKITSVTFYKEVTRTVTFALDGGNGDPPGPIQVYHGDAIGTTNFPESPTKTDHTFLGWKNEDGDTVTATTPIMGDWTLTAQWILTSLTTPFEVDAPANDTLFVAGSDYAGGTTPAAKYLYEGMSYWIVADARTGESGYKPWSELSAASPPFGDDVTAIQNLQQGYGSIGGYTRIGFDFSSITSVTWSDYTKVTITYDLVQICGNTDILVRDSTTGSSATTVQSGSIPAGTDKTLTFNISALTSGGISIVKNGNGGAFLLRITKVTLHY